jgi:uncharacterized protein (AIM24 family)
MTTHIQGGLGGALRTKVVRQDSLFKNVFTATAPGQTLLLAPGSEGAIDTAMIDVDRELYLQSTSLLAWTSGVVLDTHSQRGRNVFASRAFLVRAYGRGQIWFSAHGAFHTVDIGLPVVPTASGAAPSTTYDGYVCEAGHLVAFTSGLKLHSRKVAAIKNYFRQGGGHLAELRGEGKLWLQTKNTTALEVVRSPQAASSADANGSALMPPEAMAEKLPPSPLPAQNILQAPPDNAAGKDTLSAMARHVAREEGAETATVGGPGGYQLQVSSFKTNQEADKFAAALRRRGHRAYVEAANVKGRGLWYRVRIGPFKYKNSAAIYRQDFEAKERMVTFIIEPPKNNVKIKSDEEELVAPASP